MKSYEITIQPISGFGTDLRGDTLFGHFCWQAAHDPSLLEGGLERQIANYHKKPFAVFSSAFPKLANDSTDFYALRRPHLPLSFLLFTDKHNRKERMIEAKEHRKKAWMMLAENELTFDLSRARFLDDTELCEEIAGSATQETKQQMRKLGLTHFMIPFNQPHNTINRLTQTTGTGQFAPYIQKGTYFYPDTKLAIFAVLDESVIDIEKILIALERIGLFGYGKDASIGMGRFKLVGHKELPIPKQGGANACYTLAPSVPEKDCFSKTYFRPFVRYGKHGDRLSHSANPFKNPVIMADEGAVFVPSNKQFFEKPYLGRAIMGVSKSLPETVVQGYTPYLPFNLEN